jgi:ABC-type nitrate/sulfonate/bicarbonate transport system substrate-binding protein
MSGWKRRMGTLAAVLTAIFGAWPAWSLDVLRVADAQKGFWDTSFVFLGQQRGFFKEQGIDLDIQWTDGGAETQQAVITGSFDVGLATGLLGVISAYAKGAPVVLLSGETTGAADLLWYVRADSPIQSLKDLEGKTVAFSRPGSSSNQIAAALVKLSGKNAKLVSTGGAPATLTQVMSGQIDVGWSAVPTPLEMLQEGKLRVIAVGNDAPGAAGQTVRVNITNATLLKERRDVLRRFLVAYQKSIDWAYSSLEALQDYSAFANVKPETVETLRTKYFPKSAVALSTVVGLDETMRDAVENKRLEKPLTAEQQAELLRPMTELTKDLAR